MTSTAPNDHLPTFRSGSPSQDISPTPALGACPGLSRCLSTTSTASHESSTDGPSRDSLGSEISRQSSASYRSRTSDISSISRQSSYSLDGKSKRRGFVRPQGTDFAASARSRESVLSLGSIAHIQYYFARTGLLDGKGAQLARKKQQQRATLDLSDLVSNTVTPRIVGTDVDSSYSPVGSSPDLSAQSFGAPLLVESPITESPIEPEDFYNIDEPDPSMLPPTVSTYNHVEKPVPRPPTIKELKDDLTGALATAGKALREAKESNARTPRAAGGQSGDGCSENTHGWYELQGLHILDVMTLAIRAAKVYYTTHEHPDRLDTIKPEKEVRADLLSVMDVLRQSASRDFAGGIRDDEIKTMETWLQSVSGMLNREEEIETSEREERESWIWLAGDWTGREVERELAFLRSIDPTSEPLPEFTPVEGTPELPTPFLKAMENGLRLVKLHNAAVQKSQRRFGAIGTFHADTQKPYRCADNIRYWVKAAELRWEVMLKVDALGIVYNQGPAVWADFQNAIFKWCRKVREEITNELGIVP